MARSSRRALSGIRGVATIAIESACGVTIQSGTWSVPSCGCRIKKWRMPLCSCSPTTIAVYQRAGGMDRLQQHRTPDSRHYGAASEIGAENWALLASIVATCKLNDVNPAAYFAEIHSRRSSTAIPIAASKTSCRADSAKRQASLNRVAAKRLRNSGGILASTSWTADAKSTGITEDLNICASLSEKALPACGRRHGDYPRGDRRGHRVGSNRYMGFSPQ